MNSLKLKIAMMLLFVALIPLATFGVVSRFVTTEIFTGTVQDYLLTIVRAKENALENYFTFTESMGDTMSRTDAMQTFISYTNRDDLSSSESLLMRRAEQQVENLLSLVQCFTNTKYRHQSC